MATYAHILASFPCAFSSAFPLQSRSITFWTTRSSWCIRPSNIQPVGKRNACQEHANYEFNRRPAKSKQTSNVLDLTGWSFFLKIETFFTTKFTLKTFLVLLFIFRQCFEPINFDVSKTNKLKQTKQLKTNLSAEKHVIYRPSATDRNYSLVELPLSHGINQPPTLATEENPSISNSITDQKF